MVAFLSSLGTREDVLLLRGSVDEGVTEGGIVAVTTVFTGGCCTPAIGPAKAVTQKDGRKEIVRQTTIIISVTMLHLLDLNSEFSK